MYVANVRCKLIRKVLHDNGSEYLRMPKLPWWIFQAGLVPLGHRAWSSPTARRKWHAWWWPIARVKKIYLSPVQCFFLDVAACIEPLLLPPRRAPDFSWWAQHRRAGASITVKKTNPKMVMRSLVGFLQVVLLLTSQTDLTIACSPCDSNITHHFCKNRWCQWSIVSEGRDRTATSPTATITYAMYNQSLVSPLLREAVPYMH